MQEIHRSLEALLHRTSQSICQRDERLRLDANYAFPSRGHG